MKTCPPRGGRWRRWALLLLAPLLLTLAQAEPAGLRFRKLGALGSEEPSMLAVLQDRRGFIWIGTQSNGLYRYDGYRASKFRNEIGAPRSLPHDRVGALFEDGQGRLWAGTQDGLARYDPASNDFTVYRPPGAGATARIIKAIIGDGRGGLWLATWGGLQHFDPASGRFTVYRHDEERPDSLASNDLNALALDAGGGLWIATWPGGLDYLAPGASAFRHFPVDTGQDANARRNIVRALHFGPDGLLWIGTEGGVLRWDSRQPWDTRRVLPAPDSRVTAFHRDQDGQLWATTLSAGLLRWDQGAQRFRQFRHQAGDPYSLPSDNLRALTQDRSGMLWVATNTDGMTLTNLGSSGFTRHLPYSLDARGGGASNAVLSLAGGPDGMVWVGGNLGMALYDPADGTLRQRYRADGRAGALSNDIVYSLYQQAGGPLWVGTANGLNRQERPGGPFRTIRFGQTASNFINWIAPGRGDVLWLGTGNSVVRYDAARDHFHQFLHDPADPRSRNAGGASVLLEDRRGRVWVGAEFAGGGLDLLDPASGHFRHLRAGGPEGLIDDHVAALHEDGAGRLWIGTARGLLQLEENDGHLRLRSHAAAVRHMKVQAIQSDARGQIWASTIAGLFRLDPASGQARLFTVADGMSGGFTANASARASDGRLYFGGVQGMTGVAPAAVKSGSVAPQVAITDVKLLNQSLSSGVPHPMARLEGPLAAPRALTLSAKVPAFTIEFAALHFTEPAQNRYAYRLRGFDQAWREGDAEQRAATYTNLDPGQYTFEVRAANHQGVWSREAATLEVTITPPLWQTAWFRLAAGAATLSLLWGLYHARIRRLTRHQARLEQLVAARTAELEESNRKLAELSTTDSLTGVGNRRNFDQALETEWRRALRTGQPLALSMLDVDHFKAYNDHYGHQAGDAALRAVAGLIAGHGRRSSDLTARYGGEEFALLSPDTSGADAVAIARAICAELARHQLPHAASPFGHLTISIGVAVCVPDEQSSPQHLLQLADAALYRAKQRGRNQAVLADGEP